MSGLWLCCMLVFSQALEWVIICRACHGSSRNYPTRWASIATSKTLLDGPLQCAATTSNIYQPFTPHSYPKHGLTGQFPCHPTRWQVLPPVCVCVCACACVRERGETHSLSRGAFSLTVSHVSLSPPPVSCSSREHSVPGLCWFTGVTPRPVILLTQTHRLLTPVCVSWLITNSSHT